jgi:hypothetical protein
MHDVGEGHFLPCLHKPHHKGILWELGSLLRIFFPHKILLCHNPSSYKSIFAFSSLPLSFYVYYFEICSVFLENSHKMYKGMQAWFN